MTKNLVLFLILSVFAMSEELKVSSESFHADENKGISVFTGNVNILKHHDELNASEVTIYTDKQNKPVKFVAIGNVSFVIETKQGAKYSGIAGKAIFLPQEKEYHFYTDVHLKQLDEKKEIQGDEVVLEVVAGKAYAKGVVKKPVIMIFDIADEEEEKK